MPVPADLIPFAALTPEHVAAADEVIAFDPHDRAYRLAVPVDRPGRNPADTVLLLRVALDHSWRDLQEAFLRTMALTASHGARLRAGPSRDRVSPPA